MSVQLCLAYQQPAFGHRLFAPSYRSETPKTRKVKKTKKRALYLVQNALNPFIINRILQKLCRKNEHFGGRIAPFRPFYRQISDFSRPRRRGVWLTCSLVPLFLLSLLSLLLRPLGPCFLDGIVEKVNTALLLRTPSKFSPQPLVSFTILVVGNPEKEDSGLIGIRERI
jgi:hypothetical protein